MVFICSSPKKSARRPRCRFVVERPVERHHVSAGEVADASTDRRTAEGRCCDDASAGRFAIVVRGAWSSASSESRSRLGAVCVPERCTGIRHDCERN